MGLQGLSPDADDPRVLFSSGISKPALDEMLQILSVVGRVAILFANATTEGAELGCWWKRFAVDNYLSGFWELLNVVRPRERAAVGILPKVLNHYRILLRVLSEGV